MRRPKTLAGWIAVTLTAGVVVAGGVVGARALLKCGTHPEAKVIAQLRADPFFAVAPPDGTRVAEKSQPGTCDPNHPTTRGDGPGVTMVSRTYQTPAVYSLDELHRLFDGPAAAAGWKLEVGLGDPGGPGYPPISWVLYCKQTGPLVAIAEAESAVPESAVIGVLVLIRDASPEIRRCRDMEDLPPTGPVPTCAADQHCGAAPAARVRWNAGEH